jgi:uncharacterized protein YprB with RNaseH-like and TPR domain
MLENTFVHIPGIGDVKERRLWQAGIQNWEMLLEKKSQETLPEWVSDKVVKEVKRSKENLEEGNFRYFRTRLPHRDFWRTFPEFRDRTVFLDIETTGLDRFNDDMTVVGLYNGDTVQTFVNGKNLDELPAALDRFSTIVSFNGLMFDMPFIAAQFEEITFEQIQLDLRFILKRLGYRGGLKSIEKQLGISRAGETEGLSGLDAIRLWRQYERGSENALEILIKYNTEDIVNLEKLMTFAYDELKKRTYSD